jgi:hypothetical protein
MPAKPLLSVCANCLHYCSKEVFSHEFIGLKYYVEKDIRCGIGGFKVSKTGSCHRFKWEGEDINKASIGFDIT